MVRGGVLRLPLEIAPDDPALKQLDLGDERLFALARSLEAPLVQGGAAGEVQPGLATKWSAGADGGAWAFELRALPGHEAEPGYAGKLVVQRWQEVLKRGPAPLKAQLADLIAGAAGYRDNTAQQVSGLSVDGSTLRVKLARPDYFFPLWAAQPGLGVLSKRAVPSAGYGPFVIAAQEGAELVLKPNPQALGDKPLLDELRFVCEPDRAKQLALYRAGKLDAANLSPADARAVRNDPQLAPAVHQLKTAAVIHGTFNLSRFPWGDSEFQSKLGMRQAMNYALDREALEADLNGQFTAYPHFLPEALQDYTGPALLRQPTFPLSPDLDAAQAALIAAGQEQGTNLIPGMDLGHLRQGILPAMATPILRDWQQISINMRPFPLTAGELNLRLSNATHEIVLRELRPAYASPDALLYPTLYSGFAGVAGNWQYLKDPEVDKALLGIQAAGDEVARKQRTRELTALLERKAYALFIGYASPTVLIRPTVGGHRLTPYDFDASLPSQDFAKLGLAGQVAR
jgi:peptide/nickel transport system substrate-binding protein